MPKILTFGTACSGIGGIDLGLRNAGMTCRFQCEILEYDRLILRQNFPECEVLLEDVHGAGRHNLPPVDLFAFGFMCTDIARINRNARSLAERTRSGNTWRECIRIVFELRPRFVVIENVRDFYTNGLTQTLRALAGIGYDAEWYCIPATAIGAPHERERVFVMAYSNNVAGLQENTPTMPFGVYWEAWENVGRCYWEQTPSPNWAVSDAVSVGVSDGFPYRVDALKALGNSVVPPITEVIGSWYIECFGG